MSDHTKYFHIGSTLSLFLLICVCGYESTCVDWSSWSAMDSCQWITPCNCARAVSRVCRKGTYIFRPKEDCQTAFAENRKQVNSGKLCKNVECPMKSGWSEWLSWSRWNRKGCPRTRIRKRNCEKNWDLDTGIGGCDNKLDGFHLQNLSIPMCFVEDDDDPGESITWYVSSYFLYGGIGTGLTVFLIIIPIAICRCLRLKHVRNRAAINEGEPSNIVPLAPIIMVPGQPDSHHSLMTPTIAESTIAEDTGSELPPSYDNVMNNPNEFHNEL